MAVPLLLVVANLSSGAVGSLATGGSIAMIGVVAVIDFRTVMDLLAVFGFLAVDKMYMANSASDVLGFLVVLELPAAAGPLYLRSV